MKIFIEFAVFTGIIGMIYMLMMNPDSERGHGIDMSAVNKTSAVSTTTSQPNIYRDMYRAATPAPPIDQANAFGGASIPMPQDPAHASFLKKKAQAEAQRILTTGDTGAIEGALRKHESALNIVGF
jgi:hypothetical protein